MKHPSITFKPFLNNLLLQRAAHCREGLQNFSAKGFPKIFYKFQENKEGFSYFYFENQSEDILFDCKIKFAKMGGCQLRSFSPYV
jgi:hypothetical protein